MSLELTATLKQVLPPVTGNGKNGPWSKQDFIIETPGDYPKKVCCTMWGDKANVLQNLSAGQQVKVSFDVESREYNGKWYTDVKAWKVEAPQSGGGSVSAPHQGEVPPLEDSDIPFDDDDSGLPF
ncbi:MAG: DUF3127 domain-containing protein [Balneolia bacterium]|nr:DUF3127 domain-containing protein [Balneolia bacterium]